MVNQIFRRLFRGIWASS